MTSSGPPLAGQIPCSQPDVNHRKGFIAGRRRRDNARLNSLSDDRRRRAWWRAEAHLIAHRPPAVGDPQVVLAETGVDMCRFTSAARFLGRARTRGVAATESTL